MRRSGMDEWTNEERREKRELADVRLLYLALQDLVTYDLCITCAFTC